MKNNLKKSLFVFAALAFSSNLFSQKVKIKSILFVGNSYTAVNDLPNWVRLIGASQGDTFDVISYAPGGKTFQGHSQDPQLMMMIQQKNYDAVILQEQSQLPSFPIDQVESECFPYAKTLVDSIRSNNPFAKIIFYMTWGRKDGDAQNCPSWPPVCTFKGMNQLLRDRYIQMAKDNFTWVAPVGAVWRDIRDTTTINLYQPDGSHPSFEGTHLAAITLYQMLFEKSINNNCFIGSVSQTNHMSLLHASEQIINDSLENWQKDTCVVPKHFSIDLLKHTYTDSCAIKLSITKIDPRADYEWFTQINSGKFVKMNWHLNVDSVTIPIHTKVLLRVKNACGTDSSFQNFNFVSIQKIKGKKKIQTIQVYGGQEINLLTKPHEFSTVQVCNLNGRIICESKIKGNKFWVPTMPSGYYYLLVNNKLELKISVN